MQSQSKEPFDLIHSDLKEFPLISYRKYKYIITFLDDFSSFSWAVKLQKKSDAFDALKGVIELIQVQFHARIKTLCSDSGGGFTSNEVKHYLNQKGVLLEYSAPHTPQQNG